MTKSVEKLSDKELKEEYLSTYSLIHDIECYGVRDVQWLYALEEEIVKRGLMIKFTPKIKRRPAQC